MGHRSNSAGLGAGKDKEYVESNEGRLVDAKGTEARYVRLYSKGNTSNERNTTSKWKCSHPRRKRPDFHLAEANRILVPPSCLRA